MAIDPPAPKWFVDGRCRSTCFQWNGWAQPNKYVVSPTKYMVLTSPTPQIAAYQFFNNGGLIVRNSDTGDPINDGDRWRYLEGSPFPYQFDAEFNVFSRTDPISGLPTQFFNLLIEETINGTAQIMRSKKEIIQPDPRGTWLFSSFTGDDFGIKPPIIVGPWGCSCGSPAPGAAAYPSSWPPF